MVIYYNNIKMCYFEVVATKVFESACAQRKNSVHFKQEFGPFQTRNRKFQFYVQIDLHQKVVP